MNGGGSVSARFFIFGSATAIASAISENGMLADIKQKTFRPALKMRPLDGSSSNPLILCQNNPTQLPDLG